MAVFLNDTGSVLTKVICHKSAWALEVLIVLSPVEYPHLKGLCELEHWIFPWNMFIGSVVMVGNHAFSRL